MDCFKHCIDTCEKVLRESKIVKSEVNEIILIGGSTHVPKLQSILSEFFSGKTLCKKFDNDKTVAFGTMVKTAILSGKYNTEKLSELVLLDVPPFSLGVETAGGWMTTFLKVNTNFPYT